MWVCVGQMAQENFGEERGRMIAETEGQIKRIDKHSYEVASQSGNGFYQVISTEFGEFACSCYDFQFRGLERGFDCKHIIAVRISQALRKKVEASVIIRPIDVHGCSKCGSENIKKSG